MWNEAKLICNFVYCRAALDSPQAAYFGFSGASHVAFFLSFHRLLPADFLALSSRFIDWTCSPKLHRAFFPLPFLLYSDKQFKNLGCAAHTSEQITWSGYLHAPAKAAIMAQFFHCKHNYANWVGSIYLLLGIDVEFSKKCLPCI